MRRRPMETPSDGTTPPSSTSRGTPSPRPPSLEESYPSLAAQDVSEHTNMESSLVLGESMVSLDVGLLKDEIPPPAETTRPEPLPSSYASSSSSSPTKAWSKRTVSRKQQPQKGLHDIMSEQYAEQIEQEEQRMVELAQEEEMIQMAMQRSLTDMQMSRSYSHMVLPAGFAQKVLQEAEQTEAPVVESPHTDPSPASSRRSKLSVGSSRRSLRRQGSGSTHGSPAATTNRASVQRMSSFSSASSGSPGGVSSSSQKRIHRRTGSSELCPKPSTVSVGRSTVDVGTGGSSTASTGGGSIRIGPIPKEYLKSMSGGAPLSDGAEAVLEVARQNLSPEEVALIEQALRTGTVKKVRQSDCPTSPMTMTSLSTTVSDGILESSRHSSIRARRIPSNDSKRSVSDGSNHGRETRISDSFHSSSTNDTDRNSRSESDGSVNRYDSDDAKVAAVPLSLEYDLSGAEQNLSADELLQIKKALAESGESDDVARLPGGDMTRAHDGVSEEDQAAIQRALREAEEAEALRSYQVALEAEEQERRLRLNHPSRRQQGNVRTITRAELEAESRVGAFSAVGVPLVRHPLDDSVDQPAAGFRMNPGSQRHEWNRRDHASVVGPNREVRTKHDIYLDGLSNAERLGLDGDPGGSRMNVGNKAYNSFMQSVKKNKKGVAAHGTGRAGSDADATKGGAMDPNVRVQITKAVNQGLIEKCNGIVKEGKEAVVYHADKGEQSGGLDVAIKVFKRIQEFRARGDYVDGDPRYSREHFRSAGKREQLELWTEKEFRNLVRASKAKVPVPTPLFYRDNILFMSFLGAEGWPSPQLREINLRKGSSKWAVFYAQIMSAVRKLYRDARLVHGDLSEYNILVVPAALVEHAEESLEQDELQAVLIDFGQAVDIRHPDAVILLQRDLERLRMFFSKQGVVTLGVEAALAYVVDEEEPSIETS